jgi:hypothetical protein
MQVMNGFILENIDSMKRFVDELCSVPSTLPNEGPMAIPVNFGRAMAKIHNITNNVLQELIKDDNNKTSDPELLELQRVVETLYLEVANSLYGLLRSLQELPYHRHTPLIKQRPSANDTTSETSSALHQELLSCLEQLEALVVKRHDHNPRTTLPSDSTNPPALSTNIESNTATSSNPNNSNITSTSDSTNFNTTRMDTNTNTNTNTNINMNASDREGNNKSGEIFNALPMSLSSTQLSQRFLRRMSRQLSQIEPQYQQNESSDPEMEAKQLVLHFQYLS